VSALEGALTSTFADAGLRVPRVFSVRACEGARPLPIP
jgi:hypothetical protein